MVDQVLELRRPVPQVLHLVEEQVREGASVSDFVERAPEDGVLVPVDDPQDRIGKLSEAREIVELDSQHVDRRNAALEEILDHLELRGGLADLTWTTHDRD